jgi:TetR/AcrR family acrAB operon transcriptional repressor
MARKTKEDAEITRRQIIDAARTVFHACGVSRSTLDKIAVAAGVTRGAVYWHYKNKTELFFAMREEATLPFIDRVVFDAHDDDPLAGIEDALREMIRVLIDQPATRETFEIISFKCEYVDEFSTAMYGTDCQLEFLAKLTAAYARAAEKGQLRPGLFSDALAEDTFLFIGGLLKHWLGGMPDTRFRERADALIHTHVALRRA